MSSSKIDTGTIVKLVVWSFLVGFILFNLEISPGDFYAWVAEKVAAVWNWLTGYGLQYILVGASIVVPIFLISHFRNRARERRHGTLSDVSKGPPKE